MSQHSHPLGNPALILALLDIDVEQLADSITRFRRGRSTENQTKHRTKTTTPSWVIDSTHSTKNDKFSIIIEYKCHNVWFVLSTRLGPLPHGVILSCHPALSRISVNIFLCSGFSKYLKAVH